MDKVIGRYVTVYYRPKNAPLVPEAPFTAVIIGDKLRYWHLMTEDGVKFMGLKGACSLEDGKI